MKIITISDTHTYHKRLKLPENADMIICSGDYTNTGTIKEVNSFINWYKDLPYKYKILVNGNHELGWYKNPDLYKNLISNKIIYLEHESIVIDGIKVFGSPYTPEFYYWAWMYNRKDGSEIWKSIPNDTDILITHGPPYGYGDRVKYFKSGEDPNVGCKDLLKRVEEIKPILHVYGHTHHERGSISDGDTLFLNSAICDEEYVPNRLSFYLELDTESRKINIL